jgi:hypothetical protein
LYAGPVPLQPVEALEEPPLAAALVSPPPLLLLFEQPLRTIAPAAPRATTAVITFLCTYLPPFKQRTGGSPCWQLGGTLAELARCARAVSRISCGRDLISIQKSSRSEVGKCPRIPLTGDFSGQDQAGHGAHRGAVVHCGSLNPAERLGLAHPVLRHEDPLGPLDQLAGFQPLA